jgi:hypothetical protein
VEVKTSDHVIITINPQPAGAPEGQAYYTGPSIALLQTQLAAPPHLLYRHLFRIPLTAVILLQQG